jgi:hypothetical protein
VVFFSVSVTFVKFSIEIWTSRQTVIKLNIKLHRINFTGSQMLRTGRVTDSLVKLTYLLHGAESFLRS